MEKQELFDVIDRFARSGLQRLSLREGDFRLELEMPAATAPAAVPAPQAAPAAPAPAPETPAGEFLRAPLVGTYYAAPSPAEPPYVQVGSRVEKGRTLCIIEAMKTMNEIPAPCDLVVEELLAEDGALVAYDAPLLRYRHV